MPKLVEPVLTDHKTLLSEGLWPESPLRRFLLASLDGDLHELLHGPKLADTVPTEVTVKNLCGSAAADALEERVKGLRPDYTEVATLAYVASASGDVGGVEAQKGDILEYQVANQYWLKRVAGSDGAVAAGTVATLAGEKYLTAPYDDQDAYPPAWTIRFDGSDLVGTCTTIYVTDAKKRLLGGEGKAFQDHEKDVDERLQKIVDEARTLRKSPPERPKTIEAEVWAARLEHVGVLVDTYDLLASDGWRPIYTAELLRLQLGLREAGIPALFPARLLREDEWAEARLRCLEQTEELAATSLDSGAHLCLQKFSEGRKRALKQLEQRRKDASCCRLVGADGTPFGGLRAGTSSAFYSWLKKVGGDPANIGDWAVGQEGSSWSATATVGKVFYAAARRAKRDQYFWHPGVEYHALSRIGASSASSKVFYDENGPVQVHYYDYPPTLQRSLIAQHAFTFELLRRTALPNVAGGHVTLIRLEKRGSLEENEGKTPDLGSTLKNSRRGPAESYSLVRAYKDPKKDDYSDGNFYLTTIRTPIHRVFATYLQAKPDTTDCLFLHDGENEFLAMTEGVNATFHGKDLEGRYYCEC